MMLDSGVDLKIVSERLGHANMTVTAQIYTHRTIGNDAQAVAAFAALIFKRSEPEAYWLHCGFTGTLPARYGFTLGFTVGLLGS